MGDSIETGCAENTDRELWREREGDYYADSIHVTEDGGIGINCGGTVFVKSLREWHRLAAIEAMPSGWQPIETAPKDGTRLLATGGGLGAEVDAVEYDERVGCWCANSVTLDDTDCEPQGYNRPTHWQPLPEPPLTSKGPEA